LCTIPGGTSAGTTRCGSSRGIPECFKKIIFQKLWLLNLDWDDPLPTKLADTWLKWRVDLDTLQKFQLPRFNIELHGFSDASTKEYAAVVYSKVTNDDRSILVFLVAAKTNNN